MNDIENEFERVENKRKKLKYQQTALGKREKNETNFSQTKSNKAIRTSDTFSTFVT
jgi:hypothetical protein